MDWKALLKTVAPVLGTALGGPLGGMAVSAIASALGLSESTEEAISTALSGAKPDDLLKLKLADQQFAKDMKALDVDLVKIAAGDRDSARKREVEMKDWTPRILAVVIVGTWGTVQWYLLQHVIHEDMRELVMRVLGTLDAALMLVLSYYYGASNQPSTVINGERRK
jgi:hypothetical protein